eukprot:459838-Ditylum_brightwellii.AAC.1
MLSMKARCTATIQTTKQVILSISCQCKECCVAKVNLRHSSPDEVTATFCGVTGAQTCMEKILHSYGKQI